MKKIFGILMVVTVLGSILAAGCGKKEDEGATTGGATAGATAGAATAGATAGTTGDTTGK